MRIVATAAVAAASLVALAGCGRDERASQAALVAKARTAIEKDATRRIAAGELDHGPILRGKADCEQRPTYWRCNAYWVIDNGVKLGYPYEVHLDTAKGTFRFRPIVPQHGM